MTPQKTLPAYRNWKSPAVQLSAAMRAVADRATKDQPNLIAMTTSVQYAKVLGT